MLWDFFHFGYLRSPSFARSQFFTTFGFHARRTLFGAHCFLRSVLFDSSFVFLAPRVSGWVEESVGCFEEASSSEGAEWGFYSSFCLVQNTLLESARPPSVAEALWPSFCCWLKSAECGRPKPSATTPSPEAPALSPGPEFYLCCRCTGLGSPSALIGVNFPVLFPLFRNTRDKKVDHST